MGEVLHAVQLPAQALQPARGQPAGQTPLQHAQEDTVRGRESSQKGKEINFVSLVLESHPPPTHSPPSSSLPHLFLLVVESKAFFKWFGHEVIILN